MRILIIIFLALFSITSFSQNAPKEDTTVKLKQMKSIAVFIDSIKSKIISDTSKFIKGDIIITDKGNRNRNSYSPLFFINILYQYKLDIVSGKDVLAFINEILILENIQSIDLLAEPKSIEIFGENGKNGVIIIQLKENAKPNFNVAGFKFIKTAGDNFH